MSKSQKELVYEVVTKFYGQDFKNGMEHTKEAKSKITDMLVELADSGEFAIKNAQENVRTYVIGCLNNHLRKDTRLNGGEKYVAANPGSRAGQGDPSIKAMRQLARTFAEGSAERAKIDAVLSAKLAEIKASKHTGPAIDPNDLPEELRDLVG